VFTRVSFLTVLLPLLLALSCCDREPYYIGFSGQISGNRGELGVEARDGAILAVEKINAAGGVNGRLLELIIRDDQGDPEKARQVNRELIGMGVLAVIGQITSGQTAAVLDMMNQAETVLISPASTSSRFSGSDDFFFRVVVDSADYGRIIGRYLSRDYDFRKITHIYDLNNETFARTNWDALYNAYTAEKPLTVEEVPYDSKTGELIRVSRQLILSDADAVFITAPAIDVAVMAQTFRMVDCCIPIFSSSWAQTSELLVKGGKAVEGIIMPAGFHPDYPSEEFRLFVRDFEERFNRKTGLMSHHAYECVMVLARGLESEPETSNELRLSLKEIRDFQGVTGQIHFDACGDVRRDIFIAEVVNNEFSIIKIISPETE